MISFRPLHIAARYGLTPVVQDLITKGSSVYALDENGMKFSLFQSFYFLFFILTDFHSMIFKLILNFFIIQKVHDGMQSI